MCWYITKLKLFLDAMATLAQESFDILTLLPTYIEKNFDKNKTE